VNHEIVVASSEGGWLDTGSRCGSGPTDTANMPCAAGSTAAIRAVAVEIAASHPDRVDKLVLNNCPYWKYDENRLREFDHYPQVPLQADGSHLLVKWQGVARSIEGASLEDIQRAVVVRLLNQLSPQRGEESHFAVFTYKSQAQLPAVKSPTLVLTTPGGSFHRRQQDVVNTLPRARLVELPDVPSNFIQTRPHLLAAVALPFLEGPGL
jgi:pimeloyl-ACP methyl ester carboxylesterase